MSAIDPELAELLSGPVSSLPALAESLPVASAVATGSGAYEGANRFDNMKLWAPPIQSADDDILPDKDLLDSRVLDTLRNDSYIAGGSTIEKDNVVGAVYLLNAKPMTKVLFGSDDEKWEEEFQEEAETKFMLYAESQFNWSDAQGVKTLTDQVRLALGINMASGETLATSEWKPDDGRPYRTAMQMVDPARLSNPAYRINSNKIKKGVERNADGEPIAYHFRMAHPSDFLNSDSYNWRRVMARKPWGRPQVLHIYDQIRADQSRGVSMMVSALQEVKMLKSFRKVELQRATVAAMYAAAIESELPSADVYNLMGGGQLDGNPATAYMADYLTAIDEYCKNSKNLTYADGVKLPVLPTGTKLSIKNPGAQSPAGEKFEMSVLRYIASALGVSYEQLARDYTNTNYSSARASRGETEKHMAVRKKLVADRYATFLYSLWLEEAINQNSLECLKRRKVPNFYDGLNREAYTSCDWLGAGAGLIDPLKEVQAYVLALNNKIGTRERVIAKLYGSDWRRELRQMAREEKAYKTAGVDLPVNDHQDMQNALSGSPQERKASAALRAEIESVVTEMLEARAA
jgi:lambda family phage portal protein